MRLHEAENLFEKMRESRCTTGLDLVELHPNVDGAQEYSSFEAEETRSARTNPYSHS
jgi:hypothetical protein